MDMDINVNADSNTSYVEFQNSIDDDSLCIIVNDKKYKFSMDATDVEDTMMPYENNLSFEMWKKCYEEKLMRDAIQNDLKTKYFIQRPDVKILYDEIDKKLKDALFDFEIINSQLPRIKEFIKYSDRPELLEKYEYLVSEYDRLCLEIDDLIVKKTKYDSDIKDYLLLKDRLDEINKMISLFEKNHMDMLNKDYNINLESSSDVAYFSKLKKEVQDYYRLFEEKNIIEEKIMKHITLSVSISDVQEKFKGYDSTIGVVPAGEWDGHLNPKYAGYGYETGLIGSFEGPQGKETGYDSRKGDIKANYKNPDASLLNFLSEVKDKDGNILYPMSSFKKGGEYYYHIFGVNDDGSINWDLVDNPRFGCKMLGNYLLVGADQRFNRARGSKVVTSLGLAIVFDYGKIEDLEEDPSHIDISMDEVLFWLKNFSHNEERKIKSLAGIYDWCTPYDYVGPVDFDYEHIERAYVNNINVAYQTNYVCIFDREDFEDETTYDSQEEFIYKLTY